MNGEAVRAAVAGAYSGQAWKKKVKAMDDSRVFALYKSLQRQKKIKI